ncbi:MAG TPA: DNA primase, partial [Paracoccus solventivorans]|nr:DNA primase [Paracoccus solventivorans]
GDAAGQRAAMRLIDMALPLAGPGQALRFALMPGGQDPDDLIRSGGVGAMRAVLEQAQPLVELLWRRETEGRVFDSPERRAALDRALGEAVARIPDPATREHYTRELKSRRWALFAPPRTQTGRFARRDAVPPPLPQTRASALVATDAGEQLIESMVLAICATHPHLVPRVESRLERLEPADPGRAALVHDLLAGTRSEAGRLALDSIMADPHVRSAPAISRPAGASETAEPMLLNALDRIESRRAAREELARAEAEIEGLADEGLTWRVTQSARARIEADHPAIGASDDLGEDRKALADRLSRALSEEIWRKRR